MTNMLQDISSSVDSLAMGKVPSCLIPVSLVQDILTTATRATLSPLQAPLAYIPSSTVPIFVNPENRELDFYH